MLISYFSCSDFDDDGNYGCVDTFELFCFAIFSVTIMNAAQVDY